MAVGSQRALLSIDKRVDVGLGDSSNVPTLFNNCFPLLRSNTSNTKSSEPPAILIHGRFTEIPPYHESNREIHTGLLPSIPRHKLVVEDNPLALGLLRVVAQAAGRVGVGPVDGPDGDLRADAGRVGGGDVV